MSAPSRAARELARKLISQNYSQSERAEIIQSALADLLEKAKAAQGEFYRLLDCVGPEDAESIDAQINSLKATLEPWKAGE